jgi:hypothetical protein
LAQVLSPVWIQQVVIGLAGERGVKPIEVLRAQAPFLDTLSFHTRWARQMFSAGTYQGEDQGGGKAGATS